MARHVFNALLTVIPHCIKCFISALTFGRLIVRGVAVPGIVSKTLLSGSPVVCDVIQQGCFCGVFQAFHLHDSSRGTRRKIRANLRIRYSRVLGRHAYFMPCNPPGADDVTWAELRLRQRRFNDSLSPRTSARGHPGAGSMLGHRRRWCTCIVPAPSRRFVSLGSKTLPHRSALFTRSVVPVIFHIKPYGDVTLPKY